ncbi:MAG: hypothetical protein U0Q18_08610 [Bryobacteraceae bacterium]
MNSNYRGRESAELDALLRAYRDACPDPEPSANFMPEIWRRIEERQRSVFFLGRWAKALATAAALTSLAMAAYLFIPSHSSFLSVESYVEALAAGHTVDSADLAEPVVDEL